MPQLNGRCITDSQQNFCNQQNGRPRENSVPLAFCKRSQVCRNAPFFGIGLAWPRYGRGRIGCNRPRTLLLVRVHGGFKSFVSPHVRFFHKRQRLREDNGCHI